MGTRGPLPKPAGARVRRDPKPTRTLRGAAGGPPKLPDAAKLLPATRAWWETWVASEQAKHFPSTAWQRLLMLAPLVELYFREPSKELLSEIRLNEKSLGAMPEDLQRLRWKVENEPPRPSRKGRYDDLELGDDK